MEFYDIIKHEDLYSAPSKATTQDSS